MNIRLLSPPIALAAVLGGALISTYVAFIGRGRGGGVLTPWNDNGHEGSSGVETCEDEKSEITEKAKLELRELLDNPSGEGRSRIETRSEDDLGEKARMKIRELFDHPDTENEYGWNFGGRSILLKMDQPPLDSIFDQREGKYLQMSIDKIDDECSSSDSADNNNDKCGSKVDSRIRIPMDSFLGQDLAKYRWAYVDEPEAEPLAMPEQVSRGLGAEMFWYGRNASPDRVRDLLKKSPSAARIADHGGRLPLHFACLHNAPPEVIRLLLEAHGDGVRASTRRGDLPLHLATGSSPGVVRLLVDAYPDALDIPGQFGQTPLELARSREPAPIAKIVELLEQREQQMLGDTSGQATTSEKERYVRVLSIDGGGIRGVAPLTVLQNLKKYTNGKEPFELFDLIAGTSTGGLIAVLLGILKVPIDKCIDIYEEMGEKIFDIPARKKILKLLTQKASSAVLDHLYDGEALKKEIQNQTKIRLGDPDCTMGDEKAKAQLSVTPHVFVVTKRTGEPYLFRNYETKVTNGRSNVAIWQALRATSAAPTFFKSIEIDGLTYIDGGIGYNNPARRAMIEARRIPAFQGINKYLLLSLGTGYSDTSFASDAKGLLGVIALVQEQATDSKSVHEELHNQYRKDPNVYYRRLNPTGGLGKFKLDKWEHIPKMKAISEDYLSEEGTIEIMEQISEKLMKIEAA